MSRHRGAISSAAFNPVTTSAAGVFRRMELSYRLAENDPKEL